VLASPSWLAANGALYSPSARRCGYAHLTHYTAEYQECGEGPPLVVIPGLAGGYQLLSPVTRLLAPYFRVISYQLRGEDDCFALRRTFGLADLVGDLAEFLDWHQLEKPAVFGVSFGGILGLEFAARFPYRLQQLVVQGVGARFETGLLQRVASLVLSRYPLPANNPFINQFFNLLFGSRMSDGAQFQFVTRQCWQTDQSIMAHRFRLVEQFDVTGKLRRIRVPTLILAGDRDLLVSRKSLAELCAGVEQSCLVRLEGCGHLACVTQTDRVAETVRRFLMCCSTGA